MAKAWQESIRFRPSLKISDKDNGLKDLLSRIDSMRQGEIFVGITEEAGIHEKSAAEGHPITVLQLAMIHEFGLGVPARPWLRSWQTAYEPTSRAKLKDAWTAILQGKTTTSAALNKLGKEFLMSCRENFVSFPFTPLAEETIRRKGFDKPLIETGQMYSSITYRIKFGGASTGDFTTAVADFRDPS